MKTPLEPFFYVEPPRPEKPVCASCKTYVPECVVPVGEGAVLMCWLCAHHVVDHDCSIEHAFAAECECPPSEIYPARDVSRCTAKEPS